MSLKDHFDLVIFDWAGTMVDFGCEAPVKAQNSRLPTINFFLEKVIIGWFPD